MITLVIPNINNQLNILGLNKLLDCVQNPELRNLLMNNFAIGAQPVSLSLKVRPLNLYGKNLENGLPLSTKSHQNADAETESSTRFYIYFY